MHMICQVDHNSQRDIALFSHKKSPLFSGLSETDVSYRTSIAFSSLNACSRRVTMDVCAARNTRGS